MARTVVEGDVAATATGDTATIPLGSAEFPAVVSGVQYIPNADITGANTNTRKLEVINEGQAGAGTTVVATLQFNSAVNATQGDEKAITLSATAADLNVADGDVLSVVSTAVGTGLADPGGVVRVEGEYKTA